MKEMKTEHTPAPWAVSQKFPTHVYKWLDNGAFRIVATCDAHEKDEVAKADARLIAAAPELLEAIERILSEVNSSDFDGGFSEAAHIKAKNALEKAKGKQQ